MRLAIVRPGPASRILPLSLQVQPARRVPAARRDRTTQRKSPWENTLYRPNSLQVNFHAVKTNRADPFSCGQTAAKPERDPSNPFHRTLAADEDPGVQGLDTGAWGAKGFGRRVLPSAFFTCLLWLTQA